MIDLHTHTIFSDGALIPSELLQRAEGLGLRAIAIADHADMSNIDWILPRVVRACEENNRCRRIKAVPGIELTHLPPELIGRYVAEARELGARVVVVHGESPVEPVAPGTNRAAIDAGADILSHPGLIAPDDAAAAALRGVHLELTTRRGHSLTNGYVAAAARTTGAPLVLNSDAHAPSDLVDEEFARLTVLGAGLSAGEYDTLQGNMARLAGLEEAV
jgi:putative hydrolase